MNSWTSFLARGSIKANNGSEHTQLLRLIKQEIESSARRALISCDVMRFPSPWDVLLRVALAELCGSAVDSAAVAHQLGSSPDTISRLLQLMHARGSISDHMPLKLTEEAARNLCSYLGVPHFYTGNAG